MELTKREARILWNFINYHQSRGMEKAAMYMELQQKIDDTRRSEPLDVWIDETMDEFNLLAELKIKVEEVLNEKI